MKPRHFVEAPEGATEIKPLRDYLVIRPLTKPGMIGGIYVVDDKNSLMAEVVAAGPECGRGKFWDVDKGDTVHVAAYGMTAAGAKIQLGDQKVIMIRARDINGVVDKEEVA